MRIALVHAYYSSRVPSGENVVVDAQASLLRRAGHEVQVIAQHRDELAQSRLRTLGAAVTAATGLGPSPRTALEAFGPDVVHVHNLFPYFGTQWLAEWPGPLVATMHNYRHLCPASTLLRDDRSCRLCPDSGSARHSVRHGCYHVGRAATVPVALGTRFGRAPILQRADVVTTLSEEMSAIFASYGVEEAKLRVLENFVEAPGPAGPGGDTWVMAGRIERSKGMHEAIAQWPSHLSLVVAGHGDASHPIEPRDGVHLLGHLARPDLIALLGRARGLLFPSLWAEGMALVCLEALSVGTPVLAFDDIPAGRIVTETGVGLSGPRSGLPRLLDEAHQGFSGLRQHCREVYEQRYSPTAWIERVTAIYQEAISRRRTG